MNQIQSAIRWGQRSNFLAVPTDASQRDERLGWTGDIQAFASTGAFNGDASNYLGQWLQTLRDTPVGQRRLPDVAPVTCCGDGVAGWGDAGTVVPCALYQRYGDPRILRENYDAMERWIAYLQANTHQPDPPQQRLRRLARARQHRAGPDRHGVLRLLDRPRPPGGARSSARTPTRRPTRRLYDQIKSAFANRWVRADGTVGSGSQTSYVLALKFGLVPDNLQGRRVRPPRRRRGQPREPPQHRLPRHPVPAQRARRTAAAPTSRTSSSSQDSYPSWGYMLSRGGTTIWERWDGIRPDGSLQDAGMNSFNHYGLGSIGDWLYDEVGGLAPAGAGLQEAARRALDG